MFNNPAHRLSVKLRAREGVMSDPTIVQNGIVPLRTRYGDYSVRRQQVFKIATYECVDGRARIVGQFVEGVLREITISPRYPGDVSIPKIGRAHV